MSTLNALSVTASTVSPIRRTEDGEFRWTHYTLEDDDDGRRVEATHYRTYGTAQRVWLQLTNGEWRQLVGTCETGFNISPGTRREHVLDWLDYQENGLTAREVYARTERIPADLL